MPDENEKEKNTEQQTSNRGATLKTIIIVALVMLVEGGAIVATMWLSGGPSEVQADGGFSSEAEAELNKPVEVLVLKDKFLNQTSGRSFLLDTELFVTVRKRNEEKVAEVLETHRAAIAVDVKSVIGRAEWSIFQEPTHATLARQIKALLDERLGVDADGEPLIMEVLVRKCIPYRADI
jgi:flagellar basal body-associated protein FliL